MKLPLSMSAAYGRSTRFGSLVTVLWWLPRKSASIRPRLAISLPNWRPSSTCQSKNPCCGWSSKTGSLARPSPAYICTAPATLERGNSSCRRGKCGWSQPPLHPLVPRPMNCGRRLYCLPACSMKNNGVCTLAWNRSSWGETDKSPTFFIWIRTLLPKDDGNCWLRRWKWAGYVAWVEDASQWKKNARGDRRHPQADGKGNRWGPHQWAEVDQENHRQDRSTTQAAGDCSRPQHCRTAAPANEVFTAYQPQEDFRRFYFRPRPPVPLSLPAAGSVRKARRSGAERGCQKEGTDR